MRAFIALELPEAFVVDTAALARQLTASIPGRFLARNTYHITLAFLGEVGEGEIAAATNALQVVCAQAKPVLLKSSGLGTFGRARDATLWLGVELNPALEQLCARLREELSARSVPFNNKPFKAHVTLARHACIPPKHLEGLAFPRDAQAHTLTLFKSTLNPEGAKYKVLATFELAD